jgi:hypothetical protein
VNESQVSVAEACDNLSSSTAPQRWLADRRLAATIVLWQGNIRMGEYQSVDSRIACRMTAGNLGTLS